MAGHKYYIIKVNVKCKEQVDSPFRLLTKTVLQLPSPKKYFDMFSTPPQAEPSNSY